MSILPDPVNGAHLALPERADPAAVIAYLDAIKAGLELVETVDEARFYVDRADLIRYLADKAKLSDEIRMTAETVAFKARQHAGRLLAALPRPNGRPPTKDGEGAGFRYVDLGVPERDARRWQEDAAIPPQVVDSFAAERLASGKPFSRLALRRWVQQEQDNPDNGPVHECSWGPHRQHCSRCGAIRQLPADLADRVLWVRNALDEEGRMRSDGERREGETTTNYLARILPQVYVSLTEIANELRP